MSALRAVLLALLVVGGSLAVAAPTSATVDSRVDPTEQRDAAGEEFEATGSDGTHARSAAAPNDDAMAQNESNNSSLGADISSFMQSSAAEIDGAVETGMWSAEFNSTTDRSRQQRLVERRTDDLRAELNDLQEQKEELVAERDERDVSEAAYKARIGQLLGRIDALQSAINATEPRARQVGTNVDDLEAIESDARNLRGPEIAAIARNTSGVGNGSGPPDGVGNGDESDAVGGPPEGVGDGSGPLEDASNRSETDVAGPPDGVGNGSNGVGNGNGTAVGDAAERGPPEDAANRTDPANGTTGVGSAPNATAPEPPANGSEASDGSDDGSDLTIDSIASEPISNAVGARTAASLRVLPLS